MPSHSCVNGCCVWGMYPQPLVALEEAPERAICPQCGHEERENEPGFLCPCAGCAPRRSP